MQNNIYFQTYDYLKDLEAIEGIKFTPREIDILACILSGKAAGIIASILGVSARTIESHTLNIRNKLECTSRNGIIEFLEKSEKLPLLKQHYQNLLLANEFNQTLRKISKLVNHKTKITLCYYKTKSLSLPFIEAIKYYLHVSGIKVVTEEKLHCELSSLVNEISFENIDGIICILNGEASAYSQIEANVDELKGSAPKNMPLLFVSTNEEIANETIKDFEYICFNKDETFYHSFLNLLSKIVININIKEITGKFNTLSKTIQNNSEKSIHNASEDHAGMIANEVLPKSYFKNYKNKIIAASFLFFSIIGAWLLINKYNIQAPQSIRGDLIIPIESALLKRPKLIEQIAQKLNQQKGIQTIALIGMGGVGKTTIARQFARLQDSSLVWEINAETKDSLINSFKNLAYTLARTKQEKEELDFINAIQNPEEKEKQLLFFVKIQLKARSNWLLIYDNLEDFLTVKNYLPEDCKIWGCGQVIITTKNSNIQNTNYINSNNIIQLRELSQPEALTLFSKIIYNYEPTQLSPNQQKEALVFLSHIPPFPLDVSVAAYYIKNMHITYDQYIEKVNKTESFDDIQRNFLKEASSYEKTRYEIITLSFKKVIGLNPEFKDMLLFICLLDSQNIPLSLLEEYKDSTAVHSLIHALKKYSLITSESTITTNNVIPVFSLHRSTQTIGLTYFLNLLNNQDKKTYLDKVISIIKTFFENNTAKDYKINFLLIPHLESLSSKINDINLSNESKEKYYQELLFLLGYANADIFNIILAEDYFSKLYKIPQKNNLLSQKQLAKMLKFAGHLCYLLDREEKAIYYCQESIRICKNLPNTEILIADNLCTIGGVYKQKKNLNKSFAYLQEALHIISKIHNKSKQEVESRIYGILAHVYNYKYLTYSRKYEIEKYALEAEKYALKALEVLNASHLFYNKPNPGKISPWVARHKAFLGMIYCSHGKYKEAIKYGFKEAQYIIDNAFDGSAQSLLRGHISYGMGEVLLRENHLAAAEKKLTEALYIYEKLLGSSSRNKTFRAEGRSSRNRILRVETRIRLGQLDEAYKEYEIIVKGQTTYYTLDYLKIFYHAAFIKYKQFDLKKSAEHFAEFFKGMDEFCKDFLDEKSYKELETKGAFTISPYNLKHEKEDIKKYLKNSVDIFIAIYGKDHPFVKDYIISNYNEAIKPWYKFF